MIQGEGVKDFLWLNLWENELSVFIFLYDQKLSIFPSTRHLQQNIKQENQHNYFNIKKYNQPTKLFLYSTNNNKLSPIL